MRKAILLLLCHLCSGCSASTRETRLANGDAIIRLTGGSAPRSKSIRSWKAIEEDRVVMQSSDYSCGAAAVATLLTHYYRDDVGEAAVMNGILRLLSAADRKDREQNGFSLLDLSDYLTARGYESTGFRLSFAGLKEIELPALIHLSVDGAEHFAILTRIRGDRFYLADSSRGSLRLPVDAFAREWTGIALTVRKPGVNTAPADPAQEIVLDRMLAAYRGIIRQRP